MPLVFTKPQIQRYLNEMGYTDLDDEFLEGFIKDLKKLIKHEDRVRKAKREAEVLQSSENTKQLHSGEQQISLERTSSESGTTTLEFTHQGQNSSNVDERLYRSRKQESSLNENTKGSRYDQALRLQADGQTLKDSNISNVDPHHNVSKTDRREHAKVTRSVSAASSSTSLEYLHVRPLSSSSSSQLRLDGLSSRSSTTSERGSKKSSKNDIPDSVKRDPVALYHYYKTYWSKQKPPGSDRHMQLRWNVRAGTMGRVPCTPCGERVNYLTRY